MSIQEWCEYIGSLTGLTPKFQRAENAVPSLPLDLRRMHELVGETKTSWREGIRRMVEAHAPELLER